MPYFNNPSKLQKQGSKASIIEGYLSELVPKPPAPPKPTTPSAPKPPAPVVPSAPKPTTADTSSKANTGTEAVLPSSNTRPDSVPEQTLKTSTTDPAILDLQKQLANLTSQLTQQQQTPSFDVNALKSALQNRFDSVKAGLLSKIEQARNKALSSYGGVADQAVQRSHSDLEANFADLAQSLKRVFEGSEAAGGYRGGMSVQGQIDANTVAQNNANAIRMNRTNTLNDIARAIEQINREAEQERIAAEADTDAQLAQALADAEMYGANYDLNRAGLDLQNRQFDFSKGIQEGQLTGNYKGVDTLEKQRFDAEQAWNEWNKQWAIENAAWQRNPDNPQVQAQILQNKSMLLANQLAQLELQNYPEEQKLKIQEYKKRIEEIGKAPTLTQYDIDIKKAQLDQIKAETELLRNPAPNQSDVNNYSKNYYIGSAMGEMNKLPDAAAKRAWLQQHAAEIIQNAGADAYSYLLDQIY